MTWTVTLSGGDREVVLPNGLRYQGSAQVVLSDEWYAQLSAAAIASLLTTAYLGGVAAYTVTVAAGLHGVVLPDGLRHKAGDAVVLSDEQYSLLSANAVGSLFSSVSVAVN
jgi:hypothetical protein